MNNKKIIIFLFLAINTNPIFSSEKFWNFLEYKLIKKPIERLKTIESCFSRVIFSLTPFFLMSWVNRLSLKKLENSKHKQIIGAKEYLLKTVSNYQFALSSSYLLLSLPMFYLSRNMKIDEYALKELDDLLINWELYRKECPEEIFMMMENLFSIYQEDLEVFREKAPFIIKNIVNIIKKHQEIALRINKPLKSH